ncbi:proteoglycan 4b isoform X2 [Clarias gariepinus]|uniref:proteoglycan 4b isoform X2 n=1 Tax=Clarias gariepinus TaxID=13013 RepID=UPI00234DB90C|nr:proteoglycan 4b isoform X2 [Clarias gariepinus]
MRSSLCLVLLLVCVLVTCSSSQRGCTGRCGENYFRGNKCQCDYECLSHKECCKDYEAVCTTRDSCKGRCGESFKRGRLCHCDIECVKYDQCCPDYETQCNTEDSSVEEEYRELEVSTPLDDIVTEDAVSGSKPSPYDTAEFFDPIENQVTPLPNLPDFGTVPSMIGSPVTDKDPENPQDNFKPEQFSPNISAPNVPPASTKLPDTQQHSEDFPATTSTKNTTSEQTDLTAKANTSLSTEPQSNDASDNPEKPASESADQNPQSAFEQKQLSYDASVPTVPPNMDSTTPNATLSSEQKGTTDSQSTSESKPSPAPTDLDNNLALKPTNPVQSKEKDGPEVNLQTQTEAQLEPSEVTTLGRLDIQNTTSADQSANITEEQHEAKDTKDILSTEDSPKFPAILASTPPSEKVSPLPGEAEEEKPTKPKNYNKNPQGLQDYQADASRDTNLCNGLPVNGLTTLKNGTIVVFRGHYFWTLDSRRNAGPAHLITSVWGIPSPIDTAFTRCNCQGKTYIFRGDKYWRFENDVMDAGFPRPISEGFGLGGHVVAALSTPQYRSRREAVLFFKRGGLAQKYTYLNTPACGSTSAAVLVKKRFRKEADKPWDKQCKDKTEYTIELASL